MVREIVFPNLRCHKVEHRDYKIPMQQKKTERNGKEPFIHKGPPLDKDMIYYDAAVLKKIERRFFALQRKTEKPDRNISMPAMAYA